jgi:hypothetical protein
MKINHLIYGWIKNEIPVEGEEYLVAVGGNIVDGVLAGYGSHTAIYSTAPPEPVDYGSKITKRALSQRLNPIMREAIRKSTDEIVVDIREDLKLAQYVDLKDHDLITSFKYLVYAGLMTQEESDLVTEPPVTQSEAY